MKVEIYYMIEKNDEFNFESRIFTNEPLHETDAFLDSQQTAKNIDDLVLPELIKAKVINFINYAKNGNQTACLLLAGCPPQHSRIISDVIANEIYVSIRKFADIENKQGDLAAALTNLSDGDVFYFEKNSSVSEEITDIFTEALCKQSITMTFGKGPSARTITLPIPKFRAVISVENLSEVSNSILETCYHIIDFSKMKRELRVIDMIDFSDKYDITFSESVIEMVTREHLDDNEFRRRLIEIRNRAYESNVKIVTEELLSDFKSITDFNEIEVMNGHDFEMFVANLFSSLGYCNVKVTPSSHDFGADVIAEKDDVKFAIQCKRYSSPVGVSAVQEVMASKSLHDCHVACVLTNSTFTPSAEELARKNLVILWDGNKLKDFLSKVN